MDIEGSILTEIWQNKGTILDGAYLKTYKVEGIGEISSADRARSFCGGCDRTRRRDRESLLWARQLVRQEGIFAGGSFGSALEARGRHIAAN
ncbi:MAG: hypothetical protein U0V48_13870 [Anaerolineales bacterium]